MEKQSYEGFFNGNWFISKGKIVNIPENTRVLITILEDKPMPSEVIETEEMDAINHEIDEYRREKEQDRYASANKNLIKIWETQAYQGGAEAQFKLGEHYETVMGWERDHEQAVYWYAMAGGQGHIKAQYNAGECYFYGGVDLEIDYKEAVCWYTKAAEQGHAEAQYNTGFCYYYGEGVRKNYKKALYWYTKAAEQGHADAQFSLWYSFYHGISTEQDFEKAAYWLNLLADNGDEDAKKWLANQNKTKAPNGKITEKYIQGLKQAYYDKDFKNYWDNFESRKHGTSEEDINRLKKKFPDIPDCLLNLLRFVDGTYHSEYMGEYAHLAFFGSDEKYNDPDTGEEVRWSYTYYLFSVERILKSRDSIKYPVGDLRESGWQGNKIRKGKVKTEWLHFADCDNNGGSSRLFIDFTPSVRGKVGQVVQYCHDPDELNVIADSFDEYLEMLMNKGYDFIQD